MNGIVIDIDPVIVRFGVFELRWYSLAIITAVIVATLMAARAVKSKDIPPEEIYYLLPWVLVAGLVGARLFHVIDEWAYYARYPVQILMFQQGGLAIWGALVGGLIAVIIYTRIRHISLGRLTDAMVPALLVAQIIGRIGCIINGDSPGGLTDLPWSFIYLNPDAAIPGGLYGVPTHPYPVYEMIWNGLILVLLVKVRHVFYRDGTLFLAYLACYSVGRFLLSYIRIESDLFLGLKQAQVISILMLIGAVALFGYLYIKGNKSEPAKVEIPGENNSRSQPQ